MNNIIILYMNNNYKMLKIMYENLHNFLHYSVHNYFFNCCTLYMFNIQYWMDWLLHRIFHNSASKCYVVYI